MPHPGIRADPVAARTPARRELLELLVLDVIYVALTVALFALVGLVAKGVEKL